MIILGQISFYLIAALSIVLGLRICVSDYDNGHIKNLMQAKLKRSEITIGKAIFFVIVTVILVLTITVIALLRSKNGGSTNVLVISHGKA
ncbi:MAG TPA: ABC transporter permease, partial [Bacilli bacterium]|nr:ABC transporter permease [Bacilli bacterium]